MAAGANRKKTRTKKTSNGVHGAGGKVRTLTPVQLALMGKGIVRARKPVDCTPYVGAADTKGRR